VREEGKGERMGWEKVGVGACVVCVCVFESGWEELEVEMESVRESGREEGKEERM